MKKAVSLLLALCMILSVACMTVSAAPATLAGDVNNDGKVTPYDALQVQAFLHGELSLTTAQQEAAIAACPSISTLSTAHIVAIFFKPLVGQNSIAPEADGLFHISSAEDMALLRSFPYAGFSIDNDIDMSGKSWTPVIFNGFVFGNGNTISNLTVSAPNNNVSAGALFVKLGSASNPNAAVSDLTLANAALTTNSAHKYAGIICGSNYGRISNVSIYDGSIAGSINSTTKYAGAAAGMNYGTVVSDGTIECNIAYGATQAYGVVGANASGASTTFGGDVHVTRGSVILFDKDVYAARPFSRQAMVDQMYAQSQVEWSVTTSSQIRESDSIFRALTGKVYTGLPYSHMMGSMDALEANTVSMSGNTHVMTSEHAYYFEDTTTPNVPTDDIFLGHIMGADCSSSIAMVWRAVSPNIAFTDTASLVPSDNNIAKSYVAKVGSYTVEQTPGASTYATSWDVNYETNINLEPANRNYLYCSIVSNADGSVNADKLNALYESYALCQPGDAIVFFCQGFLNSDGTERSAGHARMVADSAHVVRYTSGANKGKIDPTNSYMVTIEQGGGVSKGQNKGKNSGWGVYVQYTFQELAGIETAQPTVKNYACYAPVTCPDFNSAYSIPAWFSLRNSSSPLSGVVASNYGILSTEVTIDGTSDLQFTGQHPKGTTSSAYEGLTETGSSSSISGTANRRIYHSVSLAKHAKQFASLEPGEHSYTITVKLLSGEVKTYSGTFTTT